MLSIRIPNLFRSIPSIQSCVLSTRERRGERSGWKRGSSKAKDETRIGERGHMWSSEIGWSDSLDFPWSLSFLWPTRSMGLWCVYGRVYGQKERDSVWFGESQREKIGPLICAIRLREWERDQEGGDWAFRRGFLVAEVLVWYPDDSMFFIFVILHSFSHIWNHFLIRTFQISSLRERLAKARDHFDLDRYPVASIADWAKRVGEVR